MQSLHGQDLSERTRSALHRLEMCFSDSGGATANIPGLGGASEEQAEQIVEEYIFCQPANADGIHYKKLSAIQELVILETLVDFYTNQPSEALCNSVFKTMFRTGMNECRKELLYRLVSMAVGVQCSRLLNAAAVWMQMQSCSSDVVRQLVKAVVHDYCHLLVGPESPLRQLPALSAHFTCNFITALCRTPGVTSKPGVTNDLLELFTEWILSDPKLCLVSLSHSQNALLQPQRTTLWTSPTKPNTQTPVPGLVKCCLLGSLNDHQGSADGRSRTTPLWSKLHVALLQTISAFPSLPGAAQLELITLVDMQRIVAEVTEHIHKVAAPFNQDVTYRLLQVLQVALATGAFRCSLADLRGIFKLIPPNRMLKILESQHLSSVPPQMHNVTACHPLDLVTS
ncbi:hypothetical protein LSAT2_003919 [Lamellibrachia satsuma]|nr:hypothetical protein LSAT2_003919 [Lamellibrachia satsuma]